MVVGMMRYCVNWTRIRASTSDAAGQGGLVLAGCHHRRARWPVVVASVLVSLATEQAIASGVFGLFGEAKEVLVGLAGDWRLRALIKARGSIVGVGIQLEEVVQRAWRRWEEGRKGFVAVGREFGFEGKGEGEGPYPVVLVEWFERGGSGCLMRGG